MVVVSEPKIFVKSFPEIFLEEMRICLVTWHLPSEIWTRYLLHSSGIFVSISVIWLDIDNTDLFIYVFIPIHFRESEFNTGITFQSY